MRKIIALCCLLGILLLSAACTPSKPPVGTTTSSDTTTTTTVPDDTTVSTDDTDWSDTTWSDDLTWVTDPIVDDDNGGDDNTASYLEVIPTGNTAQLLNPQKGGADAEAEALRQEILNTKDNLNITGNIYYVSPSGDDYLNDGTSPEKAWKSCDGVVFNDYLLQEGDAVLFERGGVYRRTSPMVVRNGVTYGAYGTGAKPAIYGSAQNYSWGTMWEPSLKENVWKITLHTAEAGIIVFNHGEAVGTPKYHGLNELFENGDFFHNTENSTLYLYLDKGYPNVVYKDIEIGTRENIFTVSDDTTDVTFDNLTVKYAGMFAFDVQDYTIGVNWTNCEIAWVGGCRYLDSNVGLGNGIQWWENAENSLVENCWIYQCYDTGMTPQGVAGAGLYKNLVFRKNLIEFCSYSIEIFDRTPATIWDDIVIEDNIMRFAGYGFMRAEKRPDKSPAVGHYVGWTDNYDTAPDITIRNNVFDCSASNLVYWIGKDYDSGLNISGNTFYQKANETGKAMNFGTNGQYNATNQAELEVAVKTFDKNPKLVKWLS